MEYAMAVSGLYWDVDEIYHPGIVRRLIMWLYFIKVIISAIIIVAVSEVSRVNATLGGLIKSLPLISLLAIIWLYVDTKDVTKVADLAISTIWFVIPTFPFFIALPVLLKNGVGFYVSLALSTAIMLACYILMAMILKNFGYRI